MNESLYKLAEAGHPLACFSYGKELFTLLRDGGLNQLPKHEQDKYFKISLNYLHKAAEFGISSSFFYLGIIYLEGIYVPQDLDKAISFYIKGAAKNNSFCFFELSRVYAEGIEGSRDYQKDPQLQFLYLKRSAEEGFVTA